MAAPSALSTAGSRQKRVPLPRIWPIAFPDVAWVIGLNGLLIVAMWIRHGGLGQAIATSGLYERGAHIRDPRPGSPTVAARAPLTSLTVVGPSLAWADAYATAGFVLGDRALDWVAGRAGYGALTIDAARRLEWTSRLDPFLVPDRREFSRTSHEPTVSWST